MSPGKYADKAGDKPKYAGNNPAIPTPVNPENWAWAVSKSQVTRLGDVSLIAKGESSLNVGAWSSQSSNLIIDIPKKGSTSPSIW